MQQGVSESTVIGEKNQTLGVEVETPDGEQADRTLWHDLHHGRSTSRVRDSRQHTPGFVDDPILEPLSLDRLPIDGDRIAIPIRRLTQVRNFAVDRYAPGPDQILGGSSRGYARSCENLL